MNREHLNIYYRIEPTRQTLPDRPVFMHGPLGPGPRAANLQGRHIKKIEIEVWYAEKKKAGREREI